VCRFNSKNDGRRIDPCMRKMIEYLNKEGIKTVSCCCGHGKYPMTIFIKVEKKGTKDLYLEIVHDIYVESASKRFYKKDKQGHYYVPEVKLMLEGNNGLRN
jgi:hypothetical protein